MIAQSNKCCGLWQPPMVNHNIVPLPHVARLISAKKISVHFVASKLMFDVAPDLGRKLPPPEHTHNHESRYLNETRHEAFPTLSACIVLEASDFETHNLQIANESVGDNSTLLIPTLFTDMPSIVAFNLTDTLFTKADYPLPLTTKPQFDNMTLGVGSLIPPDVHSKYPVTTVIMPQLTDPLTFDSLPPTPPSSKLLS